MDADTPCISCNSTQSIPLGVVGVGLTNTDNRRRLEIYALLDIACATTMMNDMVAEELRRSGKKSPLAIGGVNTV